MIRFFVISSVIIGSILLWQLAKPDEVLKKVTSPVLSTPTPQINFQTDEKRYEFVPYWTMGRNFVTDSDFGIFYFGVGVDRNGIDRTDPGYTLLPSFVRQTPNSSETILTVRMVDKEVNADVLKNIDVQEKIATEAVALAEKHNFDGILLDYETSAFGFESTTKSISGFYTMFGDKVKSSDLLFYVTLYGDTYYRARPYDVKKIGEISDKVIIMAYDFSKSRGNPGPNFPLIDNKEYGYDFGKMIDHFQKDVDNQKLVVALGYFGYDWRTDSSGTAVANGVPLSTNKIKQDFMDDCEFDNCKHQRDSQTHEPFITYTDKEGRNHIVWYEDEVSASKKIEFLKQKGILEIANWAYSYY